MGWIFGLFRLTLRVGESFCPPAFQNLSQHILRSWEFCICANALITAMNSGVTFCSCVALAKGAGESILVLLHETGSPVSG